MNKNNNGLREKKRHETRRLLEVTAIKLVTDDGLEQTTIEAISSKANLSPRTFFNYFDSKEDALLGFHNIEIDDSIIATCADNYRSESTTSAVVRLLLSLAEPVLADRQLYKMRRQLIKQYPRLLDRQMNRMAQINKRLISVVQRIALDKATVLSDEEADTVLALCNSSVRVVIQQWAATNKKLSLPSLEKQAIQSINEVLGKI